jgi:hypothetical protein
MLSDVALNPHRSLRSACKWERSFNVQTQCYVPLNRTHERVKSRGVVCCQGNYTDKGYVSKEPSSLSEGVPGLPFLVGVTLALFGALGYVVSQTS